MDAICACPTSKPARGMPVSMYIYLISCQRFGKLFSSWKVVYPEGADSRGLLTFK